MLRISYSLHIKLKDALDDLPFPYDSFLFLNITAYLVHRSTNLLLIKNFLSIMRKVYCFFCLIIFLHLIPKGLAFATTSGDTLCVVPLRSLYQTNVNNKKSLRYHHVNRAIFQLSVCLVEQQNALNCLRLCCTATAV